MNATTKFVPGQRVTFNGGFPGTVIGYYSTRMIEIRSADGRGCVCIDENDAEALPVNAEGVK
jgi:hypothetical protein